MSAQLKIDQQGAVLVLLLSNPQARNALHPDIYRSGLEVFERIEQDRSVRAVVLAGEGNTFCAGGNLNRLLENRSKPAAQQAASINALHQWVSAVAGSSKPVIAAVEGAAAGAGFSLAMAADMLVAAEDARFVMSYVKVGLTPDGGATHWLGTRLPYQTAFELVSMGSVCQAPRLHHLGVVNRLCQPGHALATALELAGQLAQGPAGAIRDIKQLLGRRSPPLQPQLDQERDAFVRNLFGADAGAGIEAFLAKRTPVFNQPD